MDWILLGLVSLLVLAIGLQRWLGPPHRLLPGAVDPADWGRFFPLQYGSYRQNYRGDAPESKLDRYPYYRVIYQGHGFSVDFNTARGHVYSLEDMLATERSRVASCLVCKSADAHRLIEAQGEEAFRAAPFDLVAGQVAQPITCASCHDPADMSRRVTNPALERALKALGQADRLADPAELRSLVCAQCHSEYYFRPGTGELAFPWEKGLTPAAVEDYFAERGFVDWVHPLAGVGLIKIQHPEYETFQDSVHGRLGMSCADCHMPRTVTGGREYTSHWWTSPFNHLELSCAACHRDVEAVRERAVDLQRAVREGVDQVGRALADLARRLAGEEAGRARELYARAHFRWDWVASENSGGFHNRELMQRLLDEALAFIEEARSLLE